MSISSEVLARTWVSDELDALRAVELDYQARRDPRAVFATAYVEMCQSIQRRQDERAFLSPSWVRRLGLAFANRYREALLALERGRLDEATPPWRQALSIGPDAPVLAHLLLGLNAHINYDLPLALAETLRGEPLERCQLDYAAVQRAAWRAIDPIQQEVALRYGPGLAILDAGFGFVDELTTFVAIRLGRGRAWRAALSLLRGESVEPRLRADALRLGRLVQPNALSTLVRRIERMEWAKPSIHHSERTSTRHYAWQQHDYDLPVETVWSRLSSALGVDADSALLADDPLVVTQWTPPRVLEARSSNASEPLRLRAELSHPRGAQYARVRIEMCVPVARGADTMTRAPRSALCGASAGPAGACRGDAEMCILYVDCAARFGACRARARGRARANTRFRVTQSVARAAREDNRSMGGVRRRTR